MSRNEMSAGDSYKRGGCGEDGVIFRGGREELVDEELGGKGPGTNRWGQRGGRGYFDVVVE